MKCRNMEALTLHFFLIIQGFMEKKGVEYHENQQ